MTSYGPKSIRPLIAILAKKTSPRIKHREKHMLLPKVQQYKQLVEILITWGELNMKGQQVWHYAGDWPDPHYLLVTATNIQLSNEVLLVEESL